MACSHNHVCSGKATMSSLCIVGIHVSHCQHYENMACCVKLCYSSSCKGSDNFNRFQPNVGFIDRFSLKFPISYFTETTEKGLTLIHSNIQAGRQTDGHDKANECFSRQCESA